MDPNPPSKKPAGMAWAAFILSFFGVLCLPGVVSFVLALVVLIKDKGGKGLAIAALIISVIGVPITGILSSIAIPNFIRFQARAKQHECKTNLKAIYMAERVYFQENDRYSEDLKEIGFAPEARRRYTYFVSEGGEPLPSDLESPASFDELPLENVTVGVEGECPACEFTAVCAGNIDTDLTLDVWGVSTIDLKQGVEDIPAGQPFQIVDDVDN